MREVLACSKRIKQYAIEDHNDWVDKRNFSVSHFSIFSKTRI